MTTTEMRMTLRNIYDPDNDPYFQWLCRKIGVPEKRHYLMMARELHGLIFHPSIAVEVDANRANDGLKLRVDFMERYGAKGSSSNRGPCTMLEFLIGLAARMDFLMGEENNHLHTGYYFWRMIDNLRLMKLNDERFEEMNGAFFVQEAVDRVLYRTYEPDGRGGLFPLRKPAKDQRKVEIWYQMQEWLLESGDVEVI